MNSIYELIKKVIICSILILFISGCSLSNRINYISKNIEINLEDCRIENDIDTHGGFLGDGEYFAKIKCSKINDDMLSSNWKKLPISKPLQQITQMKQCYNDGCKDMYERFLIPNISNGYYYFLDRHSDSVNKFDDTELNNRSSWNFTLVLLDKDTSIIYYYELDT